VVKIKKIIETINTNPKNILKKFSSEELLKILRRDREQELLKTLINEKNIKEVFEIMTFLFNYSKYKAGTKYYLYLLDNINVLNEYCENIFLNYKEDKIENLTDNEFEFHLLYTYAVKNKIIKITDKTIEENEIIKKIKKGDKLLFEQYLEDNKGLICKLASIYTIESLEYDDLYQEGVLGIIKAINNYDPNSCCKFSTYAVWWIRQVMVRYIQNHRDTIRIPTYLNESLCKINSINEYYKKKYNREATIEEIAKELKKPKEYIEKVLAGRYTISSLNEDAGDDRELGELIPSTLDTEKEALNNIKSQEIKKFIMNSNLTERERKIIFLRFGILDGIERTLEEIGKIYSLSRERVRQIESKALAKLGTPDNRRKIIDFMDVEAGKSVFEKKSLKKTKTDFSNLYLYFLEKYDIPSIENIVDETISKLDKMDVLILRKKYGINLKNPISGKLTKSEYTQFYKVIQKMDTIISRIVKREEYKIVLKKKSNEELCELLGETKVKYILSNKLVRNSVIIKLKYSSTITEEGINFRAIDIAEILNVDVKIVLNVLSKFLTVLKEVNLNVESIQNTIDPVLIKRISD